MHYVGYTLVMLRSVDDDASNAGVSNEAMGLRWEEHNESIARLSCTLYAYYLSGFEMRERTTHVSVLLRLQYMLSMMLQGEFTIHRALA